MNREQEVAALSALLEGAAAGALPAPIGPVAVAGIEAVRHLIAGSDEPEAALEAFKSWVIADVRARFARG